MFRTYNKVIERAERGLPVDRWVRDAEFRQLIPEMIAVARERDMLLEFYEEQKKLSTEGTRLHE